MISALPSLPSAAPPACACPRAATSDPAFAALLVPAAPAAATGATTAATGPAATSLASATVPPAAAEAAATDDPMAAAPSLVMGARPRPAAGGNALPGDDAPTGEASAKGEDGDTDDMPADPMLAWLPFAPTPPPAPVPDPMPVAAEQAAGLGVQPTGLAAIPQAVQLPPSAMPGDDGTTPLASASAPAPLPAGTPLVVPAPSGRAAPLILAAAAPAQPVPTPTAPAPFVPSITAIAVPAPLAKATLLAGIAPAATAAPAPTTPVSTLAAPAPAPASTSAPPQPALATSAVATPSLAVASPAAPTTPTVAPTAAPAPAAQVFAAALRQASRDEAKPSPDAVGAATAIAAANPPHAVAATRDAQQAPLDTRREQWPAAMIERIEALRDAADANDTRIRLVPDALGSVNVQLRQDGDTMHVHLHAEQPQTRDLLASAQPQLTAAAEARGLRLGSSVGGDAQPGGGSARQPQPQTPTRPAGVDAPAPDLSTTDDARIA